MNVSGSATEMTRISVDGEQKRSLAAYPVPLARPRMLDVNAVLTVVYLTRRGPRHFSDPHLE